MAVRIVAHINTLNLLLLNLSIYFSAVIQQQLSNALGYFDLAVLLFLLGLGSDPTRLATSLHSHSFIGSTSISILLLLALASMML